MNESLWAHLDDSRPAVRRATYALVSACCRHAPRLLRPPPPSAVTPPPGDGGTEAVASGGGSKEKKGKKHEGVEGRSGKRSRVATPTLLVGIFSEEEVSNHREAWQAALLVLREFKQTWMADKGAAVSGLVCRTEADRFGPWLFRTVR